MGECCPGERGGRRDLAPRAPAFLSKSEIAYQEVRRRILGGLWKPGSTIGQARLAEELGISTTPLREALKRLDTEGLVVLGTHRDAHVVELSSDEAQHLYEVRAAVDPVACELAAQRRQQSDIARIEAALADLEPLTGVASPDALLAHRMFHRALYLAAANPVLVGILDGIWDKSDLYRQSALRHHPPSLQERKRVHDQHARLRDAVAEGDAGAARSLSHAHITHSLGRRAIGLVEVVE